MIISIPTFDEILKLLKFDGDKNEISLEYVAILSDFQNKTDLFIKLFKKVLNPIYMITGKIAKNKLKDSAIQNIVNLKIVRMLKNF